MRTVPPLGEDRAAPSSRGPLPRLPRVYVPRAALWRRLDQACERPVTLLVAPAGAGKTLGVSGWLRHSGQADVVWLHADEGWRPERFRAAVRAAWQRRDPAEGRRRLVVVDDAHALPSTTLREIDRWLAEEPGGMRLLLVARWDLPLSRLVPELLGQLTVLRGDVLRLDDAESRSLILAHTGIADPAVVDTLVAHTHGWCAATVLASRAVAGAHDPAAAARQLADGGASVTDRVAVEVFASLSARQRHLLLCLAADQVVTTTTAAHLSHDRGAGDLLADFEMTGLLVSRAPAVGDPRTTSGSEVSTEVTYRIHPLLTELARRTLMAGGPEVEDARASVVRAVRLDRSRGDSRFALPRLVAVDSPGACADLLAEEGVSLVLRGRVERIRELARRHPATVERHPDMWFSLAVDRWYANDIPLARHWFDRILDRDPTRQPLRAACVRLLRSRLGLESMPAAVDEGRRVAAGEQGGDRAGSELALLLTELGVTENWLGELAEAEGHLTLAIRLSRAQDLVPLAVAGLSHLAFTQLMLGRERACAELASHALQALEGATHHRGRHAPARAHAASALARLCELPASPDPAAASVIDSVEAAVGPATPLHTGDLCTLFWSRILASRVALSRGSWVEAEAALETPMELPALPDHLLGVIALERGFLAHLASDREGMQRAAAQLHDLGAVGEATLVRGLLHDLVGERRDAAADFLSAAADATIAQPPTRALALACAAQLLDALGDTDAALPHLREAAVITEVRRNAVPFLGWCRVGTPIRLLLETLHVAAPTPWLAELSAAAALRPDYVTLLASSTPTPRERAAPADHVTRPMLSPREREVLNELARGSTYADIADQLFLSSNTVKTHVSSLYDKLAVGRRSEALAVARTLGLL